MFCKLGVKAFFVDRHIFHDDLKKFFNIYVSKVFKLVLDLVVAALDQSALEVYQQCDSSFEDENFTVQQKAVDYATSYLEVKNIDETSQHPVCQIECSFDFEELKVLIEVRQVLFEILIKENYS